MRGASSTRVNAQQRAAVAIVTRGDSAEAIA
jgi:hypothetical protein